MIVCAVDFSELSRAAVAHASRLAQATGAALHLVHALEARLPAAPGLAPVGPMALNSLGAAGLGALTLEATRQRLEEAMTALVAEVGADPLLVTGEVRTGQPADAICDVADEQNADLVAVGTHARGLLTQMLLGSTASAVMRRMQAPVLAVPVGLEHDEPAQGKDALGYEGAPGGLTAPSSVPPLERTPR